MSNLHEEHLNLQEEHEALKSSSAKRIAALEKELLGMIDQHQKTIAEKDRQIADRDRQLFEMKPSSLEPETKNILKFFFDRPDGVSGSDISRQFRLQQSVADYHCDILLRRKFITQTVLGSNPRFQITGPGRDTVMRGTA